MAFAIYRASAGSSGDHARLTATQRPRSGSSFSAFYETPGGASQRRWLAQSTKQARAGITRRGATTTIATPAAAPRQLSLMGAGVLPLCTNRPVATREDRRICPVGAQPLACRIEERASDALDGHRELVNCLALDGVGLARTHRLPPVSSGPLRRRRLARALRTASTALTTTLAMNSAAATCSRMFSHCGTVRSVASTARMTTPSATTRSRIWPGEANTRQRTFTATWRWSAWR